MSENPLKQPASNPVGIMVAPNGARLTQSDHPEIPITLPEVVKTVGACVNAGAVAVHLHVRDAEQRHVLDAGRYQASIDALESIHGVDFPIQVTTEAVGRYSQAEQIALMKELKPRFASVALAEMAGEGVDLADAEAFYHWSAVEQIGIQHILYSPDDLVRFLSLKERGVIPPDQWSILFVLGRYTPDQQSDPALIQSFLSRLEEKNVRSEALWMICAFGSNETICLGQAATLGGHVRVGFENNRLNADSSVARSNEERVTSIVEALARQSQLPCNTDTMRRLLGGY